MHPTIEVKSVAVDWITVTAADPFRRDQLRAYGVQLMMEDAARGNKVGPFRSARFVGGRSKYVGVGEWQDRVLVAVAGAPAADTWRGLLAWADNCTRIDLQVSVKQQPYNRQMAVDTWMADQQRVSIEGRRPQYDLYARKGEGSTLYIGDGNSRYLARLYERFPKTKDEADQDVWRYEVECKRERAAQTAHLLADSSNREAYLRSFVWQHFSRRGVTPIFEAEVIDPPPPLQCAVSDADTNIRWLGKAVRPMLSRLRGWGREGEALSAMGLTPEGTYDADQMTPTLTHP